MEIAVVGSTDRETNAAVDAAFEAVAKVHALMSFHDGHSDVSRLNRQAGKHPIAVHAWTYRVLQAALDLHRRSGGVFDITVAPVLQRMGLLPCPDGVLPIVSTARQVSEPVQLLPDRNVRFGHPAVRIDLGGIAKGFAVDCAVDVLRRRGLRSGMVNAGGDLRVFGPRAESVHVRSPDDPRRLLCRIEVNEQALASSGPRFDPYRSIDVSGSAVIDARTRSSARLATAATVLAPSCMIADALTKVVMIEGRAAADLLECYGASALIVLPDGKLTMTQELRSAVHLAA